MNATSSRHQESDERYEIRFEGHLHARWADWFDGLTVTDDNNGTTIVEGDVADQAALHGLLRKLHDLGLPLLSVNRLGPTAPVERPSTIEVPTHAQRAPTGSAHHKMTSRVPGRAQ